MTALYLLYSPTGINLFSANSITDTLSKTLQLLPGFYIASLAVISSFNSSIMDQNLSGGKITLTSSEHGKVFERELTRRRFLCYLFGYLSFSSLVLVLLCTLTQTINPQQWLILKLNIESNNLFPILIDWCLFVPILFLFWQLMILTFFGLFYLTDRVHWESEEEECDKNES